MANRGMDLQPEHANYLQDDAHPPADNRRRPIRARIVGGKAEYTNVQKLPSKLWETYGIAIVDHVPAGVNHPERPQVDLAIVLIDISSTGAKEQAKLYADRVVYTSGTWAKVSTAIREAGYAPYAGRLLRRPKPPPQTTLVGWPVETAPVGVGLPAVRPVLEPQQPVRDAPDPLTPDPPDAPACDTLVGACACGEWHDGPVPAPVQAPAHVQAPVQAVQAPVPVQAPVQASAHVRAPAQAPAAAPAPVEASPHNLPHPESDMSTPIVAHPTVGLAAGGGTSRPFSVTAGPGGGANRSQSARELTVSAEDWKKIQALVDDLDTPQARLLLRRRPTVEDVLSLVIEHGLDSLRKSLGRQE